jgi:hypothetical protein
MRFVIERQTDRQTDLAHLGIGTAASAATEDSIEKLQKLLA